MSSDPNNMDDSGLGEPGLDDPGRDAAAAESAAEGADSRHESSVTTERGDESGGAGDAGRDPEAAGTAGGAGSAAGDSPEDDSSVGELSDTQDPYADEDENAAPIESLVEDEGEQEELQFDWYILKVQVNREESIRDALMRRVKMHGLEHMFGEIVVPTEDVAEFNKSGKRRIVKKKLYPGYIMVNMAIDDDSWFLVRETPGIGDFTGSAGKPTAMDPVEVERIISRGKTEEGDEGQVKTAIPFKSGDQVRVKDGNFQGFEGDVESIDEAHGRVTVMINIFGRPTPVELEHWQIESV